MMNHIWLVGLLGFYILETSTDLTQDGYRLITMHSWRLYCVTPLGDKVVGTMTWFPIRSHHHDMEPISPCPILVIASTRLLRSHCFDSAGFGTHNFAHKGACALLIWSPYPHNWSILTSIQKLEPTRSPQRSIYHHSKVVPLYSHGMENYIRFHS